MSKIEEFDYGFLISALSAYKNPRVKINALLKKDHIIRVKKGLYVFGPKYANEPYSKETLANLIYGPSYISLEYALSFHGLIPERVEVLTSITYKRNKLFNTPVGAFSYRYIHPLLYSCQITLHPLDDLHTILIASPEKTLCDSLYYMDKIKVATIEKILFEDMRIDKNALLNLDISKVEELARLYGHNAQCLLKLLRSLK